MKERLTQLYRNSLKIVPALATFMLIIGSNSTATWVRGQEEFPETAKKYRKF